MGRLDKKVCVVTGAGNGIGRAIAQAFLKEGAYVAIADINLEAASKVAGSDPNALAVEVDVASPEKVAALEQKVLQKWGKVDCLVNNAAIQISKPVEQTSWEEWNRQMTVNVGGVFLCTKTFLPHLRKTQGSIVNLSSVNGFFVEAHCAGYCATKAAIIGFTKAVAIDHGRERIRCNCICPGYIDAGLAEAYFQVQPDPAAARAGAGKLHAIGRIGLPEEVARAAVYLASDESSFVTGSSLVVDGGFSAGLPLNF